MGFSIKGYVLEPPRVGQSNSPFTSSPNNFISNPGAFSAAYPNTETNPRTDYLVLVTNEGTGGLLRNASFGWTKNEVVRRFDYQSRDGRFKPLPGGVIVTAGPITLTSNTQRLKVAPVPLQVLAAAPFRLSIGTVGSGITQTVVLVLNDLAFGAPPSGTTELSQSTGNLNWNPSDLAAYDGQSLRFQQQAFFDFDKSTGDIGLIDAPVLLLNPIPGTGQFPLIRIGFSLYLTPIERPNEAGFSPDPAAGTVEWALTTGRLKFHSADIAAHLGFPIYYDGSLFAIALQLPRQSIGTIDAPTPIIGLPPDGGDIIFDLPVHVPYVQFAIVVRTATFDSVGKANEVQVNPGTGAVQFSIADRANYTGSSVEVVFGDLVIDHGVSLRLFRTPVNLDASGTTKDVTTIYTVQNAVWASPIIGSPQVFLPSVPIDDPGFPMVVSVLQGTGSFTGTLNRLDVPSPPAGLGYFIDFDARTFHYAQRKNQTLIPLLQPAGTAALPDPLALPGNVVLELETGAGTGIFNPLTIGTDALLDPIPGLVTFTTTQGVPVAFGVTGSFSGTSFTDAAADFVTAGVVPGDFLVVSSSSAKGVYTVATVVSATQLTTDVFAQTPSLTGPPTPVSVTNAAYTIERGKEVLADRFFQQTVLIDPSTMVERIRGIGVIQNATVIVATQSATFTDFLTLSDSLTNFITAGVQVGDTILLNTGPDAGTTRTVTFVAQNKLTVASNLPFSTLTAATYSVTRRLRIPITAIGVSRFRFGTDTLSTTVNPVPNDSAFTNPVTLPVGIVEVSQVTGNLNFSNANIIPALQVYWIRKLTPKTDYLLSPQLGLIQFTDRMLSFEEVLVTYTPAPPVTTPPTPAGPPIQERATFLVRKELTQPHPTPTSIVHFNPTGRTVATTPPPAVFRGGRPQQVGVQCNVDTVASTVTFLPDAQITNVLPHGAVLGPAERVLVDYFVYEAIGGEKTTNVLQPPMLTALVIITQDDNSFVVHGDQTTAFPSVSLLRIEQEEVYLIGSSSFDVGANITTVTLFGNQKFQNSFTDPKIFVTSGLTRLTSTLFFPAYFTPELQSFDPVARGMNKIFVFGDRTAAYRSGVVVYFTDGVTSFSDFIQVTGAQFHADTGKTEVTLAANALRQYVHGPQILQYTVRPIFEEGATTASTSKVPVLTQPFSVFRREEGEAGILLTSPTDYQIDDAGTVKYTPPLRPAEEVSIFYTGHRIVDAGPRVRASYTFSIAPTSQNGLDGQILQANYSIFSPDTFYYRVETLTNFKGEVSQEIQAAAQSGSPSSGPQTSNSSSPQLFQQGRESVFFQEGHLANEDLVARGSLKFFNDAVNFLEDALHALDGRVVGDNNGRFLFDGNINNPVRPNPAAVTNQIDDQLVVSPFPLPSGTTQAIYLQGPFSRFFKNRRDIFATSPAMVSGSTDDGDAISKGTFSNLSSLPTVAFKRKPRAQIQFDYPYGTTTFVVDNANGINNALQRPSFVNQMRVVIEDPQGRFYVLDSDTATVSGFTATTVTISVGAHSPTPGPDPGFVPAGSTIYLSPSDANTSLEKGDFPPAAGTNGAYMMQYRFGHDIDFNLSTGEFLYSTRSFPYNGILSILPPLVRPFGPFFDIFPVQNGDILQVFGAGVNIASSGPFKFPALYGGTTNDDLDQSLPIVGPTFDGELTTAGGGPLNVEVTAEQPITGTLRLATTVPYVGTGALDVTTTIITDANVSFPAPLPQVYDLVRILTGLNGATEFRRVIAVGVNTVTVDSPFAFQDTGFTYTIAVSSTTVTGTGTLAGTSFTDLLALFTTTVQVGWTVVMTGGANTAQRRQIVAVVSNTQLTLDSAFTTPIDVATYKIDNPLDTYGGPGSILARISTALATELATINTNPNSEQASLLNFLATIFTTIVVSVNGSVTVLTQLTDITVDFQTSGVNTSHFVYIQTGPDAGIYPIASVDTATQLTVTTPFPSAGAGINYQIVSAFGAGLMTFQDIFGILSANTTFTTQTQAFQTLVNTPVPVLLAGLPDPPAFARGILTPDLDTRAAQALARTTYLTDPGVGPIAKIQKALTGSDRLYDKRFSWIDARINLETGYLVKEQRAVANRLKAQADILNQLIKLLTVQGS